MTLIWRWVWSFRRRNEQVGSLFIDRVCRELTSCCFMPSTRGSWLGYPLMDVMNIMYLGLDQVKPEKQLGTIKLISDRGFQYLYKVDVVDIHKPCIKYGDSIPVMVKGPTYRSQCVSLEFDLFCGAYKGSAQIWWEPALHEVTSKSVFITSNDGTGRILVNVACFANAVVANLELRLSDAATNVHGVVFSSNSELELGHCASVLFREMPDTGLKVEKDGVISLSRSLVAVPLHSEFYVEVSLDVDGDDRTTIVSFDTKKGGVDNEFIAKEKDKRILVKVTWYDASPQGYREDLLPHIYDLCPLIQKHVTPLSVDESQFVMEEEVALEFHLLKDEFRKIIAEKPTCPLSGVTSNILSKVIYYCKIRINPSTQDIDFDAKSVKQLDPAALFILIQAAHHLQLKSVMNLTCRTLVNKVKKKTYVDIIKEFNIDDAHIRSAKRLKRSYSEEDIPPVDSLRQRERERFINKSLLVDVPISPLAAERKYLFEKANPFFDRRLSDLMESADPQRRDPVKLYDAILWLDDLPDGDAGLADSLCSGAVRQLFQILVKIDESKDMEELDIAFQSLAVRILSRALSHASFHDLSMNSIPDLVKLLSNPHADLKIAGLMALTRISYWCYDCMQAILENGALEAAQEISSKFCDSSLLKLKEWVAKFLAVSCYRHLPDDKVKVALTISDDLFTADSINRRHIALTCYALQYLTYKKTVAIEGEACDKLIRRLFGLITNCFRIDCDKVAFCPPTRFGSIVLAGSALGVVGNIARWGDTNQIQILANDSRLLQCLGKILCVNFKKFSTEACQIISNIVARSQTWIQDMHKVNLIEPLCRLLEEDILESDAKMEAAWAIFNGIYGNIYRQIDKYSTDDDLMEIGETSTLQMMI